MSSRYIYAMLIGLLTVVSINSNFLEEGPLTKEAHEEIDQLFDNYMTCMFNGKFALDKAWLFQVLNNLVGPWKDDGKK